MSYQHRDHRDFAAKVLIVAAVAALCFALYQLATVFLLIIGAIVIATIIRALAEPISHYGRVPRKVSIGLSIMTIVLIVVVASWLFGRELVAQGRTLIEELPSALGSLRGWVQSSPFGRSLLSGWDPEQASAGAVLNSVRSTVGGLMNAGVYLLVAFACGAIFALGPGRYRDGLLFLAPPARRARIRTAMNAAGRALNGWLLGQFVAMAIIGVFVSIGLLIVGLPSWLFLGVIAGVAQFVPLIGPTASAIPGLIVALAMGPSTFFWTGVVYFGVQQIESNFITPYVMSKTASLPMALTLLSILGFGLLFGPLGVVLATPLTVIVFVLVQSLYVEAILGQELDVKGEAAAERQGGQA